jgi:hypothetical protein
LNKFLHRPTVLLRESTAQGDAGLRRIETVRELFGLEADAKSRKEDADAGER